MLEVKQYHSSILHDISFVLPKEENLIILGQNGAGKSTLAKVLSQLIPNESVYLDSKRVDELSSLQRALKINYIPPKLSVFDDYITLQEFLELSFIDEVNLTKIQEVIQLLKLQKLQHRCCKEFSSGEKQLTLLASALIHNAQITIFDELTANLDISRLKEVFDIFNSEWLAQKVIITHNLDLAYALKYKVMFIKEGKIAFLGEHDEFFSSENLKRFYNDTIIKLESHLVVNL